MASDAASALRLSGKLDHVSILANPGMNSDECTDMDQEASEQSGTMDRHGQETQGGTPKFAGQLSEIGSLAGPCELRLSSPCIG